MKRAGAPTTRIGIARGGFVSFAACVLLAACAPAVDLAPVAVIEDGSGQAAATEPEPVASGGFESVSARSGARPLPSDGAAPGENFLQAVPARALFGTPSLDQILSAAAPLPAPFEFVMARDFRRQGGLSYVSSAPSPGVTCVLAVEQGAPAAGATLLRNCVHGDLARALAPLASPYAF